MPVNPWPVPSGNTATMEIFIKRSRSSFKAAVDRAECVFTIDGAEIHRAKVPLLGPGMRSGR